MYPVQRSYPANAPKNQHILVISGSEPIGNKWNPSNEVKKTKVSRIKFKFIQFFPRLISYLRHFYQ